MNDFDNLQDWVKGLNKTQAVTKEQLIGQYMQYPWFRRNMAKKEDSSDVNRISILLTNCRQNGRFIEESDGQFTGGYSVEVYRYNNEVFEFGYQDGELCDMTRFEGELY